MLCPTPLSLLYALLLYLPLAIVFTTIIINTTTTYINENPQIIIQPRLHKSTKPPFIPPNDDDDEPLFKAASQVNPKLSSFQQKKLAFMFLTNTPFPFSPLWELYFNQTTFFNIYIHADPTCRYDTPFSGVFANRVIPSKPTRRFSPTLISAARRLLAHALLDDPSNSMFILLSPSCIPIHSFNFTYKTLINSKKSFIEILNNEVGAYDRWATRGNNTMLPEVRLEDFRIGSQFWVLTRKHARIVVSDHRLWSKFKLPCVRLDTCFPEENYFSTLLSLRDPLGCVPATLTHVDWRGSIYGHPRTYKASEVVPQLILSLRRQRPRYGHNGMNVSDLSVTKRHDPFLFARKFSIDSIQPLMSIAHDVIFKD
ncbi:glycosyltransferase BC10 [Quercus suber]|uniref:Core-2/I-branching beta-1,6-N-acetylglucosaminyltransferase family protein n=1 Tax=Quercus suber TaxID=58331 RepID=A0AAW0K6M1_QUESU|nr:uncharacterized protein LOC112034242 [Quercus suber]POE97510.1 hypothetical protein CFP56_17033 [Quercus suber]